MDSTGALGASSVRSNRASQTSATLSCEKISSILGIAVNIMAIPKDVSLV